MRSRRGCSAGRLWRLEGFERCIVLSVALVFALSKSSVALALELRLAAIAAGMDLVRHLDSKRLKE